MQSHNPAIKRLRKEYAEFEAIASDQQNEDNSIQAITVFPLEDNIFEWHFTLLGPEESEFEGGRYHGRIQFPPDYPFSPPSIMFLTPNGRFETDRKVCLSVTGFHPESWQPAWGVRTMMLALREHFKVADRAAIGFLDYSPETRKDLAIASRTWRCGRCSEPPPAAPAETPKQPITNFDAQSAAAQPKSHGNSHNNAHDGNNNRLSLLIIVLTFALVLTAAILLPHLFSSLLK